MLNNEIHVSWIKTLDPKQNLYFNALFYFAWNVTCGPPFTRYFDEKLKNKASFEGKQQTISLALCSSFRK